jgi:hypothetical protein
MVITCLKDAPLEVDSMYYSGGSSRIGSVLPKRTVNGDEEVDIGNFLEENGVLDESVNGNGTNTKSKTQSLLSSLMVEGKGRTPMDLIQVFNFEINLH